MIMPALRRPTRRKLQFEALEPRLLLSTEIPVVPPSAGAAASTLSAPFSLTEVAASQVAGTLVQWSVPEPEQDTVMRLGNDWAQNLANPGAGVAVVLDFSAATRDLRFAVHGDGSVDVSDGTHSQSIARVTKLIGSKGNDSFAFDGLPGGLVIETGGQGQDVVDFSGLTQDLEITTFVDGRVTISDGGREVAVSGKATILGGQGENTYVTHQEPVIAGSMTGGVFSGDKAGLSLAAYAASHLTPRQIVFIDPSVENYQTLLGNLLTSTADSNAGADTVALAATRLQNVETDILNAEFEDGIAPLAVVDARSRDDVLVVKLDASWDGVEQISQMLAAYQGVAAVHILSHGAAGSVRLGNASLNSARLGSVADRLRAWGQSLMPEGDILLYGCNVAQGEAGFEFVRNLGELTGADVAASTGLTGAAALGGDWELEFNTGAIQAAAPFDAALLESYGHLLAAVIVNGDAGANQFIIANATATKQGSAVQNVATTDTLTVNGLAANDTFTVQSYSRASSTTLDGGAGTGDKADLSGVSTNMNVVLAASGTQITVYDVAGGGANGSTRMTVNNVEEFLAGAGTSNTLNLSALTSELLVRIIGKNKVEVSQGSGSSWTKIVEVSNVQNVIGGNNKTHFVFFGAGSLDGYVDGHTASGNVLSYSDTYTANGGSVNADPGISGPADYSRSANVDLALAGSASSLKKGVDGGFKNIQQFIGGAEADVLTGNANANALSGGGGADSFRFVTTGEGSDTITDFAPGSDKIEVTAANFGLIAGGTANLVVNGVPATSAAAFLYSTATGVLAFDADGNNGGAAVQLATLSTRPVIGVAELVLGG